MKMRKVFYFFVIIISILFLSNLVFAEENILYNNFSIGYSIGTNDKDFSISLNITSPFFFNSFAIRINGMICFNQLINSVYNSWLPYYAFKFGFVGSSGLIYNMRYYGEGGLAILIANENITSKKINYGGYGLFGFEFFLNNILSYFIEIGSNGLNVKADKLINSPDLNRIYFNGFFVFVGLRIYL